MITPLRPVFVTDTDPTPWVHALERGGYDPVATTACSSDELAAVLADEVDVVLTDGTVVPLAEVVERIRDAKLDLPILFVTDAPGAPPEEQIAGVIATEDIALLSAAVARVLRLSDTGTDTDAHSDEAQPVDVRQGAGAWALPASPGLDAIQTIAEHLPVGLYQSTPDGRILYANPALAMVLGFDTVEELHNLDVRADLGYPREPFVEQLRRDGIVRNHIACWTDSRGRTKYTRENARIVYDAAGTVLYYEGTMEDVTERERWEADRVAEAAQSLAQEKALVELARLSAYSPDDVARCATQLATNHANVDRVGVWVMDKEAGVLTCLNVFDRAAETHINEPPVSLDVVEALLVELEQGRGLAIEDAAASEQVGIAIIPEYLAERGIQALLQAPIRREGRVVGIVAFHNTRAPRTWTLREQEFAAGIADVMALAFERDEREAAEAALRESEARYRAISDLASDYAFALHIHPDGRSEIAWATEAFERVTGYKADDLDGLDGLLGIVHPDSQAAARDAFATASDDCCVDVELHIVTREGEGRWVRHRAKHATDPGTGLRILYHSGQDVTERKHFEEALIAAREAAEEMARLKSAFLANMSHEIRTPLTSILGYADILSEEIEGEHREFVGLIEQSGRRLLDTLNSVLELARLEADHMDPDLEAVDVAAEAEQDVQLLLPLAERKGLALTVRKPAERIQASLDRACFGRILTNLIGNAIKFTEEGRVHVEVANAAAEVLVTICDTGVGIAPSFLPHLFDEFRQESSGHARSHEGSGLGLSITRRLVELHSGSITVESERPGGTTFTIAFPRLASASQISASTLTSTSQHPADSESRQAERADSSHPLLSVPPKPIMIIRPLQPRNGSESPSLFVAPEDLSFDARLPLTESAAAENPTEDDIVAPILAAAESIEDAVVPIGFRAGAEILDLAELLPSPLEPAASSAPNDTAEHAFAQPASGMPVTGSAALSLSVAAPRSSEPEVMTATTPDQASPPMLNDLLNPDPKPTPPDAPTPEEAPAANNRPAVLVVEDNEDTRMLLERLLKRSYQVLAVGDARAALNAMNTQRFDALVLDINLGGKQTGVDILKVARAIPGYDSVFAVALTAYALPGDRERFLEEGFNRYVSKPFTRSTLMEALEAGMPSLD